MNFVLNAHHYYYHWLWGLRYSASPQPNNIKSLINQLSRETLKTMDTACQQIASKGFFVRLCYRLFNINNYAFNRHIVLIARQLNLFETAMPKISPSPSTEPASATSAEVVGRFQASLSAAVSTVASAVTDFWLSDAAEGTEETTPKQPAMAGIDPRELKGFEDGYTFKVENEQVRSWLMSLSLKLEIGQMYSWAAIRAAYKQALLTYHPDKLAAAKKNFYTHKFPIVKIAYLQLISLLRYGVENAQLQKEYMNYAEGALDGLAKAMAELKSDFAEIRLQQQHIREDIARFRACKTGGWIHIASRVLDRLDNILKLMDLMETKMRGEPAYIDEAHALALVFYEEIMALGERYHNLPDELKEDSKVLPLLEKALPLKLLIDRVYRDVANGSGPEAVTRTPRFFAGGKVARSSADEGGVRVKRPAVAALASSMARGSDSSGLCPAQLVHLWPMEKVTVNSEEMVRQFAILGLPKKMGDTLRWYEARVHYYQLNKRVAAKTETVENYQAKIKLVAYRQIISLEKHGVLNAALSEEGCGLQAALNRLTLGSSLGESSAVKEPHQQATNYPKSVQTPNVTIRGTFFADGQSSCVRALLSPEPWQNRQAMLSVIRHQSPQNQHLYDKHYGLTVPSSAEGEPNEGLTNDNSRATM